MNKKIKTLKSRISKSKDGKALVSNFGYLMLLKVASYIFPLLTIPYLARVIGVNGFGKIAFAAAVIVWFQTVADWGFNYTATRDIAKNRDNPVKVAEIFSSVLWARILLTSLSFLLLLLMISCVPYFKENKLILLATFLVVPGGVMFPEWFFQAMERMKFITIFNLVSKALLTVMVFAFIKEEHDYILQPLFLSLGYVVCGAFSLYLIIFRWGVSIQRPEWRLILLTIRNSTDVFVNNIMPNFYNSFSTVLVGFYGGSASNGMLDAGRKFVGIGKEFTTLISVVFFPFLSRRKVKEHKLYAMVDLSIAFIFSMLLFFSAPWLIGLFFTDEFEPAILVLQVMSFFIFSNSLINVYGVNYLVINGFERLFRNITVILSVVGFVSLFPAVYFFDYVGAAVVVTLTRTLIGGAVYVTYKNKERKVHE